MRLHLAVDISRAADGKLSGELTSLNQANAKVPLSEEGVVGRAIRMSLPKIQGSYDALLDPGQTRIEGDWTQNGSLATPAIHTFGPPIETHVSILRPSG